MNPETKFIWAFIAPVIAILLINIGFIIMAAIVMWKHNKKKSGTMDKKKIKRWLKVTGLSCGGDGVNVDVRSAGSGGSPWPTSSP